MVSGYTHAFDFTSCSVENTAADEYTVTGSYTFNGNASSVSMVFNIKAADEFDWTYSGKTYEGFTLYSAEYDVTAELSCFVNAMGGIDFGTQVYKGASIEYENGEYNVTIELGTGTGVIYTVQHVDFVDPRNSTPGYYDADGNVVEAEYTISETETATPPSTDEDYENGVHYVTSMTFPVSKEKSEYNVWIYINSNVMGVQFCDGSGSSSSNHPNEATPYVGKLTIDWDSLALRVSE